MPDSLLIADSDQSLCEIYLLILDEFGIDTEYVISARDCIESIAENKPSYLLLDDRIQWGGGIRILNWIQEMPFANRIPVILTGNPIYEAAKMFPDLVIGRFIKPILVRDLVTQLLSLITVQQQYKLGQFGRLNAYGNLEIG